MHGVYRRDPLLKSLRTFLTTHPWGGDVVFLLEMCLTSEITGSDTAVMYKRVSDLNNSHITLPKTPRQIVGWQCWYAAALMRVILNSPISAKEKQDLIKTYVSYLKTAVLLERCHTVGQDLDQSRRTLADSSRSNLIQTGFVIGNTMPSHPSLTVILPAHNAEATIASAIASTLNQSYSRF